MDYDRPTQAFLSRYPEAIIQEAERLRSAGSVKQIFGGDKFVRARVEEHDDVYHVTFTKNASLMWDFELIGPEKVHPAVVVAAMLERAARGDSLPESPNEIGGATLTESLEQKLGRNLTPDEDRWVDKLEKRYKKYEIEQAIYDTDLIRLSPKWKVEGFEPLTLWPQPPKNILEFWSYIAAAFEKRRIPCPSFMDAVTEKAQTREQMREWERNRAMQAWQNRVDTVLAKGTAPVQRGDFRLLLTTREARLQFRRTDAPDGPQAWANVTGEVEMVRLRELHENGGLVFGDTGGPGEQVFSQWLAHWPAGEAPAASLRLELRRDREFIGRLLRQPGLTPSIVTLDETPFVQVPAPLHWICIPSQQQEEENPGEAWQLQFMAGEDQPVPYALTVLPGPEDAYLSDEAVFRGPRAWMDEPEAMPRYDVPREVIESETGVDFLRRLDVELPEELKARTVEAVLRPKIALRMATRGPAGASDGELVYSEATAADEGGLREERLEKESWKVLRTAKSENGHFTWFDRRALHAVPPLLDELSMAYDATQKLFRVKLTRTFPDKFAAWLSRIPPAVEVTLDRELETLRADPLRAAVRFEVSEAGEIDWFDLKVLVDVEGMDLTKAQIRQLVEARGGFVRMSDGGWLRLALDLTPEQTQAINRLGLDMYDLSGEVHRMHALQLAEPAAAEIFDIEAWNRICDRAERLKLQIRPNIPEGFRLTLRPYQVEGFHFLAYLASNRFGGILADDMGLGKTAQTICWILWLRDTALRTAQEQLDGKNSDAVAKAPPILVCAPKSVLDVWAGEVEKFAPDLRIQVIRDKSDLDLSRLEAGLDVMVLNYSQLRVNADKLKSVRWLATILDEGQQIKNPDSQAARTARELQADHRLVLSGTPIENRLLDMWSLMAFAQPGVLGNRKYFRDRFDKRKDGDAQVRLSARLRPFILRRTKGQVAVDLPSRTEEDIYSALEEEQEKLYAAELQRMQRLVLGLESDAALRKNSFAVLQGLTRLRQICCHPSLIDDKYAETPSAKTIALFYLLDQLRDAGHKVLVFSQFVTMLEIVQQRLQAEDRPHVILTGQTKDRADVVQKFQTSKDPTVFLLSLKAGGAGLNLTAASYVVLYDPWWNPAVENQAIDRTHRIGQTNPVIAYRLIARNTVEEKIRRLQYQKQALFSNVLGEESFAKNLNLTDVRDLFAREPDAGDK